MLAGPRMPNDPIHLADWVELRALASPDGNASTGDLAAVLTSLGAAQDEELPVEELVDQAFDELLARETVTGDAYPFSVAQGVLSVRDGYANRTAYLYCLFLSFFGYDKVHKSLKSCSRLFEELARDAAIRYIDGDGIRFGWPRVELPTSFRAALDKLCTLMGEGERCKPIDLQGAKDGSLDVVAWRNFPDKQPGKILIFGQCACGNDWREKTREVDVREFSAKFMAESPATSIVPAFFVPHRFEEKRWRFLTLEAGIVFDRCRVARYAHDTTPRAEHAAWISSVLSEISLAPAGTAAA